MSELGEKVVDLLEDQTRRGHLIKFTEAEAKSRYPKLAVTAQVLFDENHGLAANTRMRIRDQERALISSDLKRAMREKARQDI